MKKYLSYKSSGVEWIGDIPEHWEAKLLKYTVECNEKALPENTEPDYELKYIEISDVDSNGQINNKTPFLFKNCPSRCRRILSKGDVIVSTVRTYLKAIGFIENVETNLICSTGFCVLTPQKDIISKYLFYQVLTEFFIGQVISKSEGVSYPSITSTELINIKIILCSISEQQQIVKFLDEKTEIINKLISTKVRKIELLKIQRTSLINQVITKGLDPNVKMKDSGVEWIGEIPDHWDFIPMKYLLKEAKGSIKTGPFGSQLKSEDFLEEGIKVYNQRTVYDENYEQGEIYISDTKYQQLKEFTVCKGDILITTRGTIGKCSIVPDDIEIGVLHPCLIRIQVNDELVLKLLIWWYINHSSLFIESVKVESNSTTIDVIYSDTIKNHRFPLPPIHEQQKIVDHLDLHTKEIDDLITLEQKKINLLKEYRQSLISEVITGKIDVRSN